MRRVLVLGASGMLGSMLSRVLAQNAGIELVLTTRGGDPGTIGFEAGRDRPSDLVTAARCEWIVNAIGMLKARIEEDPANAAEAMAVNSGLPRELAEAARDRGARLIHPTTDGVFSGREGPYDENAVPDATDTYARTKSRGEVQAPHVQNLRCSIVGPERGSPSSLLGWALSQPPGARIAGFTDQRWNGITTWHLARLCEAIITGKAGRLPSPLHVVPRDAVTKAELLELMLLAFGRSDVTVERTSSGDRIDRTLTTRHPEALHRLWAAAGYERPPRIIAMLDELAGAVA